MNSKLRLFAMVLWLVSVVWVVIDFFDIKKLYDETKTIFYSSADVAKLKRDFICDSAIVAIYVLAAALIIIGLARSSFSLVQTGAIIYLVNKLFVFARTIKPIWRAYDCLGGKLVVLSLVLELIAYFFFVRATASAINNTIDTKWGNAGTFYILAIISTLIGNIMILAKYSRTNIKLSEVIQIKDFLSMILVAAILYITCFALKEMLLIERGKDYLEDK